MPLAPAHLPSLFPLPCVAALPVDFSVQVLTTGWWPTFPTIELQLPSYLTACEVRAQAAGGGCQVCEIRIPAPLPLPTPTAHHHAGSLPTLLLTTPPNSQAVFKEYYAAKTQHRRIAWVHSSGTASVRALFGPGGKSVYDLQVAALQAAALVLFNDRPGASRAGADAGAGVG